MVLYLRNAMSSECHVQRQVFKGVGVHVVTYSTDLFLFIKVSLPGLAWPQKTLGMAWAVCYVVGQAGFAGKAALD